MCAFRTPTGGVFFDLGSGQNVRDFEMYDYAEGSGMGSSIPLFFRMYADRCIDFHAIYAWEVPKLLSKTQVPSVELHVVLPLRSM